MDRDSLDLVHRLMVQLPIFLDVDKAVAVIDAWREEMAGADAADEAWRELHG